MELNSIRTQPTDCMPHRPRSFSTKASVPLGQANELAQTAGGTLLGSLIWLFACLSGKSCNVLLMLAGLSFMHACGEAPTPKAGLRAGQTSLLLIILDTTRADHLGAWGYPTNTSPELDRIAAQGVRFSRCYASAPWTRPAIASLLTGLYPRSTGVHEEEFDVLPLDLITMAECLQAEDYLTLGLTANPNTNAWFQFNQGFDEYVDSSAVFQWMLKQMDGQSTAKNGTLSAEEMNLRTLSLLERHAAGMERGPFFLQTLYIDPHRPYRSHDYGFEGPNRAYDGEIRYMDEHLTLLLKEMTERGYLRDTLVVITADHGEGLDSHPEVPLAERHGYHLYDSSLHVPLILWHPSLQPRVIDTPISSIDVLPTLMELIGLEPPAGPGLSFAAAIRGQGNAPERPYLYAETEWRQASKLSVSSPGHRLVRSDDSIAYQTLGVYEGRKPLKALLNLPGIQLHALGTDSFEHPRQNNLWEAQPELAEKLTRALSAWERATPSRTPERRSELDVYTLGDGRVVPAVKNGFTQGVGEQLEDQLKALGYMGEADEH